MSNLTAMLAGVSWELLAIGGGVGLVLAAGFAALWSWRALPANAVVARIDRVVTRAKPASTEGADANKKGRALWSHLARPLVALTKPTSAEELSRLRARMVQAGLRSERAMDIFLVSKLLLAGGATLTFLQVNSQLEGGVRFPMVIVAALVVCAVAFFLPNIWLASRVKARQTAITRALPDAMDLLVTCVEAGLALDAALARVADELKLAAPILAGELNLTFLETQAGIARRETFRRLSERTGVEDLSQLAAVLTQTEIFGTSVSRALRVQADGMRISRMQLAEKKAAMVGVKMMFPLVLCVLPALVCVVMGPAIVTIATNIVLPP